MLGGAGTTGFRTWEAALQFSQFLCSDCCPADLRPAGKTILELGAGTGFLSILCAKYLSAAQVYATDGFEDVVEDIGTNMFINELQDDPRISRRELRWGQALLGTEEAEFLGGAQVDLVLGADVTYAALPELVATIGDLFDLFPKLQVVIASTIRNDETYGNFLGLCSSASFEVDELDWVPDVPESQKGPFYSVEIPVKIVRITVKPGAKRPGAWSTT
jgi:ribosomal protein L11 methylase PrmA